MTPVPQPPCVWANANCRNPRYFFFWKEEQEVRLKGGEGRRVGRCTKSISLVRSYTCEFFFFGCIPALVLVHPLTYLSFSSLREGEEGTKEKGELAHCAHLHLQEDTEPHFAVSAIDVCLHMICALFFFCLWLSLCLCHPSSPMVSIPPETEGSSKPTRSIKGRAA